MIRTAVLDDVTEIAAMLLSDEFWTRVESYKDIDLDIQKGKSFITSLINSEDGIVGVAVEQNKIIGIVIGQIITSWFGSDKYSTDYVLYVHSNYRSGKHGYNLLKYFTEETQRLGVTKFITQLPYCNFNVTSMQKLLKRQGFKEIATVYEKEF